MEAAASSEDRGESRGGKEKLSGISSNLSANNNYARSTIPITTILSIFHRSSMMIPIHSLCYAAIIIAVITLSRADAFSLHRYQTSVRIIVGRSASTSSSHLNMDLKLKVEGCAAKPLDKKKIAVFGAGGYLGAVIFGFLQRAASL